MHNDYDVRHVISRYILSYRDLSGIDKKRSERMFESLRRLQFIDIIASMKREKLYLFVSITRGKERSLIIRERIVGIPREGKGEG